MVESETEKQPETLVVLTQKQVHALIRLCEEKLLTFTDVTDPECMMIDTLLEIFDGASADFRRFG